MMLMQMQFWVSYSSLQLDDILTFQSKELLDMVIENCEFHRFSAIRSFKREVNPVLKQWSLIIKLHLNVNLAVHIKCLSCYESAVDTRHNSMSHVFFNVCLALNCI